MVAGTLNNCGIQDGTMPNVRFASGISGIAIQPTTGHIYISYQSNPTLITRIIDSTSNRNSYLISKLNQHIKVLPQQP